MKTNIVVPVLLSLAFLAGALAVQVKAPPAPASGMKAAAPAIPPLPAGVSELRFRDFFVQPVGPRGLELTDTLCQLDGKKVRILGYMARERCSLA